MHVAVELTTINDRSGLFLPIAEKQDQTGIGQHKTNDCMRIADNSRNDVYEIKFPALPPKDTGLY